MVSASRPPVSDICSVSWSAREVIWSVSCSVVRVMFEEMSSVRRISVSAIASVFCDTLSVT
jgi:hypothetical protein